MNVLTPPEVLASSARVSERRLPLDQLSVVVIGGGPVGLAAAAHLLERGIEPLILEAGPRPGAAVREWGHVPMFSPWAFNIDRAAWALLERHGWTAGIILPCQSEVPVNTPFGPLCCNDGVQSWTNRCLAGRR